MGLVTAARDPLRGGHSYCQFERAHKIREGPEGGPIHRTSGAKMPTLEAVRQHPDMYALQYEDGDGDELVAADAGPGLRRDMPPEHLRV